MPGLIEGIMLKKTFPYLRGKGYNAGIAACVLVKPIFVSTGTLKASDKGRVCASSHEDWWFCRVNGPLSCAKDYEWSEEITTGGKQYDTVIRTGVRGGDSSRAEDGPGVTPPHEADTQEAG